ncbi:DASS family divalent anion:Na+ symporter [Aneurinibacillus soli]|uniref:Putative malate transporter YflS n=2 Tax=Aneurinibacillus soli TaxID=1500254 RepID=A0A0U5B5G8_9BACL|nr:anion permease [Aneurinibacillus soli]PYE62371.1 DASS family divalent anion:Na+ symporter [Aneurinibacillus soli]BAU26934.1 putative malate transporter YflS [Aneurinibacillus soli]
MTTSGEIKRIPLLIMIAVGIMVWLVGPPAGVKPEAWHLLAIFVATIIGFIMKPMPMGSLSILAITTTVITGILPLKVALSGFSNSTIWIIVCAIIISRGVTKTGLGARVAYIFVKKFGKKTLGLSYALAFTDFALSPAMPSNSARAGGVIFPIIHSLSDSFGSKPEEGTERKIGSFLTLTAFQVNVITSAMFMTAMAANPLAVSQAKEAGVSITWGSWALAAIVPGLISLLVIPWFIYKIYPPEIKETPDAAQFATDQLKKMGPMSNVEKRMLFVFGTVLLLWIFGERIGIDATTTAIVGVSLLLLTQVLSWGDVTGEKMAWDTLVWFAALVMMATQLNQLGLIPWFSKTMGNQVAGMSATTAFLVLILAYFYSHYLFASATAHVSAMYAAFLTVAITTGTPGVLAALILGFFSNLFGSMTHYGFGPAPILFGPGYVSEGKWWSIGFMISIINIIIWLGIGLAWWKVIGLW